MENASAYKWLVGLPAPKMITEAVRLWQNLEKPVAGGALLEEWRLECLGRTAKSVVLDPVPWSGTFITVVAHRARKTLPPAPQWALNWAKFGVEAGQPQLGDVLCLMCENGAQVGLYVGEDDAAYHSLGAHHPDRIAIVRIPKIHLYAARRPIYQDLERTARTIRLTREGTPV
ncbi:MAG: hypothetical protein ACRYG4_07620 [Janthinobacterium lividum]